jgi:hypothetical protein
MLRNEVSSFTALLLCLSFFGCEGRSQPEIGSRANAIDAPLCDTEQRNDILADPADPEVSETVDVTCSLELQEGDWIRRRAIFRGAAASGVSITCLHPNSGFNGGPGTPADGKDIVEIRSRHSTDPVTGEIVYEPPEDITIRGCTIEGATRIWGMAKNANGDLVPEYQESSKQADHVQRVRAAAPRSILFEDVTIVGHYVRNPLYIAPGVRWFELRDSELTGHSDNVAIYLDAESYGARIIDNLIHMGTGRELIAVDASAGNVIRDNYFSNLDHGGIYLYRNCGEYHTSRHTTPSWNQIVNNVFYYDVYSGNNPSIFLGSRNGNRPYCGQDSSYPYGSAVSNLDYASNNVVAQNQIYERSVSDMIRVGSSTDADNVLVENETVTSHVNRSAGCYFSWAYRDTFLLHGESTDLYQGPHGEPRCIGAAYGCTEGEMTYLGSSPCSIEEASFDCSITGNDNGCRGYAVCPFPKGIIGMRAGCNLEWGSVSVGQLATVEANTIEVFMPSYYESDGLCWVGRTSTSSGIVSWGRAPRALHSVRLP